MILDNQKRAIIQHADTALPVAISIAKFSLTAWLAWTLMLLVYWRQPDIYYAAFTFWGGMEFEYLSQVRIIPILLGWRKSDV